MGEMSEIFIVSLAGIVSHWSYFICGEHHLQAPRLFRFFLVSMLAVCLFKVQIETKSYKSAVEDTITLALAYILPLYASMTIYRVFFHRLSSFPGPSLARVSKIWHVYYSRHSKNHELLHALHEEYGDFVRTGPSEITVFLPEALIATNGPKSTCTRSAWYDFIYPMLTVTTVRSRTQHAARRKMWDRAFSFKALTEYDHRIMKYTEQLETQIARRDGQVIHVNDWIYWFAFDVMGDLLFAKSFNMLLDGKWHYAISLKRGFMWLLGPFTPVPWLVHLGVSLPGVAPGFQKFISWCKWQVSERQSNAPEKTDLASFLLEAAEKDEDVSSQRDWLYGDTVNMVVAGSDTVAVVLIFVFRYLAIRPEYQNTLRAELNDTQTPLDPQKLTNLPFLRSILMETMRLHPPLPTGSLRDTDAGGLMIADQYIPPHTTVCVPRYTLVRLESAFECAEQFIPERWTSKPHMVRDKRAYSPFSQGPYDCIGKNFAYREMSYMIASIVSKFDIELAPGEDGTRVFSEMKDAFTAVPGPLNLVFRSRKAD